MPTDVIAPVKLALVVTVTALPEILNAAQVGVVAVKIQNSLVSSCNASFFRSVERNPDAPVLAEAFAYSHVWAW